MSRLAQTPKATGYGLGASLVSAPIVRALGALVVTGTGVLLAVAHGSMIDLAVASPLAGVGIGSSFAAMPALIAAAVPPERTGSATSLNEVLRTVGGAVGSAAGAAILTAVLAWLLVPSVFDGERVRA